MAKVQKDAAKRRRSERADDNERSVDLGPNLGGFLGKLGGAVEKLVELAEAGKGLSQTGELKGLDPRGKLRGVYGFSVKTAVGNQGERELKIEPFGDIRRQSPDEPVAEDLREPLVDIHEERDHLLVLAEIPGVSKKDVELEISGDRLTIRAQHGQKRYHKEVVLPEAYGTEGMRWECTNGILKIRLEH